MLSKCDFWLREVIFLGHVISNGAIAIDPSKVDAMLQWEASKIATKIISFLGLTGYYQRFIEGFPSEDEDFRVEENGILKFRNKVYVLDVSELKKTILEESHRSSLSIHSVTTKCTKTSRRSIGGQG